MLIACSCATTKSQTGDATYASSASANYRKGLLELKDENYEEALKYFNYTKSKFPFSQYAALSELRIADTFFAQEKFTTAADAYSMFIRLHPTHPKVRNGYAGYRVCECHVKQIPGDWFILPPSHEKDQTATASAMRELQQFIQLYRDSKYHRKADRMLKKCVKRLVQHELYVAHFYLERGKPRAAILRLEGLRRRYPSVGNDAEVMLLLGKTYLEMNQRAKAKETFQLLAEAHPSDPNGAKAKLFLKRFFTP